jgi:amino acid transporter
VCALQAYTGPGVPGQGSRAVRRPHRDSVPEGRSVMLSTLLTVLIIVIIVLLVLAVARRL